MHQVNVPQPAAAQFAAYIEAQKENILTLWGQSVAGDDYIRSAAALDLEKLRDHLPQILDELCRFLRQCRHPETSDKLHYFSETHGLQRWLQGYSLKDVVLEIERFRMILLIDLMREFVQSQSAIDSKLQLEIEHSTYIFFRELTLSSVLEYTEADQKELRSYSEDLADTNKLLNTLNSALRTKEAKMQELSLTDPLTDIANRRHLERRLSEEIERSRRYGEPLTIALLDLDFFKKVNDEYGHEIGDRVLQDVASQLQTHCRSTDLVARFGGEEFVLLLSNTPLDKASTLVERMCTAMAERIIAPLTRPVTGSLGVAQWMNGESGASLLARADNAMYRAKAAGRNGYKVDTDLEHT